MAFTETSTVLIHQHTGGSSSISNPGTSTETINSLSADQQGDLVLGTTVLSNGTGVVLSGALARVQNPNNAYMDPVYANVQLSLISPSHVVTTSTLSFANGPSVNGKVTYATDVHLLSLAGGGFVIGATTIDDLPGNYSDGTQNPNLYFEVFSAAGAVVKSWTQVNTADAGSNDFFSLAPTPGGGFEIQWGENDEVNGYLQQFTSVGAATGSKLNYYNASVGGVFGSAIAADAGGYTMFSISTSTDVYTPNNLVIVGPGNTVVYNQSYAAAEGSRVPVVNNPGHPENPVNSSGTQPQVVALAGGGFLITLFEPTGPWDTSAGYPGYNEYVQKVTISGGAPVFGTAVLVKTTTGNASASPLNPLALSDGKVLIEVDGVYRIIDPAAFPSDNHTLVASTAAFPSSLTPGGAVFGTVAGQDGAPAHPAFSPDQSGGVFTALQTGTPTMYYGTLDATLYAADFNLQNQAPTTAGGGNTVAYVERGAAVVVNAALTVSDADSANLTGATATISANAQAGDVLAFTAANGISGSYNATTHVLTLSGSATVAQYQSALESVTFANATSHDPTAGGAAATRTVGFQVNDGQSANNLSNVATSTINVAAIKEAPTISGTHASSTSDATSVSPFMGVTVADPDAAQTETAVVSFAAAYGSLSGLGAATVSNGVASYSTTGTATQVSTALQAAGFTPTHVAIGSVTTTLTLTVSDGAASASDTATLVTATASTPAARPLGADLAGDGHTDLVFREQASGSIVDWNGASASDAAARGLVPASRYDISLADFSGDGRTDILFRETSTGRLVIWDHGSAAQASTPGVAGAGYEIYTGDFTDDGKADILFRNSTTGDLIVWDDANAGSSRVLGQVGTQYTLTTGDLEGDGKTDIIFQQTSTHTIVEWSAGAVTQSRVLGSPGADWMLVSARGDFDGDGKGDLLFLNTTTGFVVTWSAGDSSHGTLLGQASPVSEVVVGDFNGDRVSDILFRDPSSGVMTVWNGGSAATAHTIGAVATNWQLFG